MIIWLLTRLYWLGESIVNSTLRFLLYLSFGVAAAHYLGWLERFIWWTIEKEATKILNKTKVTVGSFRLDWSEILQGKITFHASNVLLHTPHRAVWGWESPVLARVGRATVTLNAPVTIFHEVLLKVKLPIEVYSLFVADVQVFIERHEHVLNVYLCDPAAILPTPPYLHALQPGPAKDAVTDHNQGGDPAAKSVSEQENPPLEKKEAQSSASVDERANGNDIDPSNPNSDASDGGDQTTTTPKKEHRDTLTQHQEQAQKLVKDMLKAVQSLGRAAQQGSLQSAVKQHGVVLAEQLRNGLSNRTRDANLEQGVAFMEQVGKAAVESLKAPAQILPERRVGDGPAPPEARIGRIVLEDLRIFTKDSWIQLSADVATEPKSNEGAPTSSKKEEGSKKSVPVGRGSWNKPIYIASLIVRAAELCPPMSLKDEDDFPAVYQRIDKIIEIVWRRLLAEMAKSNGGRLFSTAAGEVLSFIQTNRKTIPKGGSSNPVTRSQNANNNSTHSHMTLNSMMSSVESAPTPTVSNHQPNRSGEPVKSNSRGDVRLEAPAPHGSSHSGRIISAIPETTTVTPRTDGVDSSTPGLGPTPSSLSLSTTSSAIPPTLNAKVVPEKETDENGTLLVGGEPLVAQEVRV